MASARFIALETALIAAGIPAFAARDPLACEGPIAVLMNVKLSARPVEHVLLPALEELDGMERECVVRVLSERGLPHAGPALLHLLERETGPSLFGWALGNALAIIRDRRTYAGILAACADARLGMSRQMLFTCLPATKLPGVYDVLTQAVGDASVRGHAIAALARYPRPETVALLQRLETTPGLYEHRAKLSVLRRLEARGIRAHVDS